MPCCAIAILALFGPRLLLVLIWLLNNDYLSRAYANFIIPCIGFLFLPWTTLAYAFAVNTFGGLGTEGLIAVGVGLLLDVLSYGGSGWGNRDRLRGYAGR
jgi:hypothetical protein